MGRRGGSLGGHEDLARRFDILVTQYDQVVEDRDELEEDVSLLARHI